MLLAKKGLSLLIAAVLILFCGCRANIPEDTDKPVDFSFIESELFPFFCIDTKGKLWRIENDGATPLNICVSYSAGSGENSFVRYIRSSDTLIFATSVTVSNGIALCNICTHRDGITALIKENAVFTSLRINNWGELLFVTSDGSLYHYKSDTLSFIESNVADAEFIGEDEFLVRGAEGTYVDGEFVYPVSSYKSGYRNYIADGQDILSCEQLYGYGLIIKSKHTVQKRASSQEVAELMLCADGEVLASCSSVVLSQFRKSFGKYLLAYDESSSMLKYSLYAIGNGTFEKLSDNVLSGKYISDDKTAYMYETEIGGKIYTNILLPNGKTDSFEADAEISGIYYCEPYTYLFENGTLRLMNGSVLLDDVVSVSAVGNKITAFKGTSLPMSIYVCDGESPMLAAKNAASDKCDYLDGYLYYYSGEKGAYNLEMTECKTSVNTALISNIDVNIGYLHSKNCIAAVKADDKMLYIISGNSYLSTSITVNRLIKNNEII